MRHTLFKRLSVLILSGAVLLGSCGIAAAENYTAPAAASANAQEEVEIPDAGIAAAVTGSGSVSVSDEAAEAGDTVTVTAAPDDGYYLAQVRYTYEDGDGETTEVVEDTGSGYTFTMPADAAVVTADFISIAWDGTIDITWYDPDEDVYTISYAAQLEGAAALTNGLFNNYPVTEEIASDGSTYELPHTTEDDLPYGYEETYYNSFTSDDGTTVIVGDITQLCAICTAGTTGSNNLVTTNDWWSGTEDFSGKTILLDADLDMGGSYTGDRTDIDNWTGPNYMPVGGQYSMIVGNGYTKLNAGFNGTFDGQGHLVSNIYCYRQKSGNFGDNESIALIGRLGVSSDDEVAEGAAPSVQNVAVDGIFYGNRSVGGIVGRNGSSPDSLISNCMNFATVKNTDAKGVGGIAGAGWNDLTIENCVNFGYIYTSYSNAGGISGNCECDVVNCYNFGYVNASKINQAQALGTNAGGAVFTNCYYLTGSARSVDYPAVYGSTSASTFTEIASAETFKTEDFIEQINAETRGWVLADADEMISSGVQSCLENIYAYTSELESYDGTGIAVPRTFLNDETYITEITTSGTPVTEYYSGKSFDADTFRIWANYSDGTKESITDYTVTYENGGTVFSADDTYVTVSGSYDGMEYSFTFDVSVTAAELTGIAITTSPDNVLYAIGETFDPTGMVVKATYTNGITEAVTDYTYDKTGKLSETDTEVTVSYTYQDLTMTAVLSIEILSSAAPHQGDGGIVEIETADDMRWFANKVKLGLEYDAILMNDIDLTGTGYTPVGYSSTAPVYYSGTFYGNDMTVTISYGSSDSRKSFSALFCGLSEEGVIQDLTVEGEVYGTSYTAGIVSRVNGGTVQNCVSYADVNGTGSYTGGIAGYTADGARIAECANYGSVTSTNYDVGGIAGILGGEDDLLDTCVNFGAVSGTYYVGGLAGLSNDANTIQNCGNEGSVKATESSSSTSAVGGILGQSSKGVTVDACFNIGEVTGVCCAGGIAGYLSSSSAAVTNCYNSGAVSSESVRTGGIAGRITANNTLQNCYNSGVLTYTGSSSADAYVGAITAYAGASSASIDNILNNYALEGTGNELISYKTVSTDDNAVYVSAETLQTLADIADGEESSALGDAYTSAPDGYNNGYPMLCWQVDSAFYTEALIGAIGEVTLESGDAIDLARTVYDALSETEQELVANYDILTEAEAAYEELTGAPAENEEETGDAEDAEGDDDSAGDDKSTDNSDEDDSTDTGDTGETDGDSSTGDETGDDGTAGDDGSTGEDETGDTGSEEEESEEGTDAGETEGGSSTGDDETGDNGTAGDDGSTGDGEEDGSADTGDDSNSADESGEDGTTGEDSTASDGSTSDDEEDGSADTGDNSDTGDNKTGEDAATGDDGTIGDDSTGDGENGTAVDDTTNDSGSVNSTDGNSNTGSGTAKVKLSKGKIKSLKNKKGRKVKVTYKKDSKAGGYQIVYSVKKNFKNKKSVKVKSRKKTSVTLKKLKKNKKYYVKVRSYKKVNGKTYYGAWSKVKTVKVKK